MTLVDPTEVPFKSTINSASVNTPVSEIAAVINGNIDDTNISSVSGSKIANATVTNAKLSTAAGELGGAWTAWTPTCTGYSGTPTTTNCRYKQIGKLVTMQVEVTGTSNATTKTVSLPVTASSNAFSWSAGFMTDSGADKLGMIRVFATTSTTAATAYAGFNSSAGASPTSSWTASGTATIRATITYEAA